MFRRLTVRWLLVAMTAAVAATAAAPTTASAAIGGGATACPAIYPRPAWCDGGPAPVTTAGLRHVGWTYLNLNHCPAGRVCAAVFNSSMPAWRWTGTRWTQASLSQGWVYVYPYTDGWRWAWTQQTGWVAVSGGRFELRHW